MRKRGMIFWVAGMTLLLCGCDPVTRYKVMSTIFDGVPRLPPAEEYCRDYHQRALVEEAEAEKQKEQAQEKAMASIHPPFAEKRCDDCHDKNTDSGFVVAAKDLCNVCHPDFIKGAYSHGPAAVGACTICHVPHNSQYAKLLKKSKKEICDTCHTEKRLALGLHNTVKNKNIFCTDCHNPHGGDNRFFLE
jgi:predicted CXXCH cytochrome family protein